MPARSRTKRHICGPVIPTLGSYDKEIVLEGLEADTSRINQRPMRQDEMPISCMPLHIEISLDGVYETSMDEKPILEEQANQPLKEINKVFYDTHEDNELKLKRKLELSRTQKQK